MDKEKDKKMGNKGKKVKVGKTTSIKKVENEKTASTKKDNLSVSKNKKKDADGKKTKKKKTKGEKKIEKELLYIIGFFVFLVVLFFVAKVFFEEMNRIDYNGMTFTKEKYGDLTFYHYGYYFKDQETGALNKFNLFIRNDPRFNDVPVEGGPIDFSSGEVYVTLNTDRLTECEYSLVGIGGLTNFLAGNGLKITSGNMNSSEAEVQGFEHITCENTPGKNVIQILRGNETRIDVADGCYTISVGEDCDIVKAVEKLQLEIISESRVGKVKTN